MNNNNKNNLNKSSPSCDRLISPVKSYGNAELFKEVILKDNKGKSGIYCWINKESGKSYVGSAVDLSKRLASYYNESELIRNSRPIKDALIKYGHKNFTLEILEYCPQTKLLDREQFYLDFFCPEYNILKFSYSLLGFKHSQETIEKLKSKIISPEHKEKISSIHKGKLVSPETRNKLAIATANYKKSNPLTSEALANIRAKTLAREGVPVFLLNTETNETWNFTNQTEAGEFLGVTRQAVYNAIKRGSTINNIYLITNKAATFSAEAMGNHKAKAIEREGFAIKVLNTQTNEVREFINQTEAGKFLEVTKSAVYNAIKRGSKVKDIYLVTKKTAI